MSSVSYTPCWGISQSGGISSPAVRADTREPVLHHTVVSGDTLWAIARKYLGRGSLYTELAEKNSIKNPNLIYPGQVLLI